MLILDEAAACSGNVQPHPTGQKRLLAALLEIKCSRVIRAGGRGRWRLRGWTSTSTGRRGSNLGMNLADHVELKDKSLTA